MPLPGHSTVLNRSQIRADFVGGTAALRFYFFSGDAGSADGDDTRAQYPVGWNLRTARVVLFTVNDPGATTIGLHLNLNLTPTASLTLTPTGAGAVTLFDPLTVGYPLGSLLSVSVDPANDPGRTTVVIALQNDSP